MNIISGNYITLPYRQEITKLVNVLKSHRYQVISTICSVFAAPRLGKLSGIHVLPIEMIRELSDMFPFDDEDAEYYWERSSGAHYDDG